ncbi:hypothetical protein NL676_021977 [Syzygium grande]|nr:hypothetical protein NL676_021977 [Syzygium grande]
MDGAGAPPGAWKGTPSPEGCATTPAEARGATSDGILSSAMSREEKKRRRQPIMVAEISGLEGRSAEEIAVREDQCAMTSKVAAWS